MTDWKRATPPTGSAEPGLEKLAYVADSGRFKERTRRGKHRCNGEDGDPDTLSAGTSG